MNVAILGGSRFIGFHLAAGLNARGHDVTIFNRGMTRPPAAFPPRVKHVVFDRDRGADSEGPISGYFDAVCDVSGYTPAQVAPLLRPEQRRQIGHYMFCSTSSVYQVPPPVMCGEGAARVHAAGTYGGDKSAVEDRLLHYWRSERWPVTVFRPQGVFGAFEAKHASFVFSRLLQGRPIFHDTAVLSKLNFLWIEDLVAAVALAMGTSAAYGKTYNVAGDELLTPHTFVAACADVCATSADLRLVSDWRHRFVPIGLPWLDYDLVIDNAAIKRDLGMEFHSLRRSLTATWDWLKGDETQSAVRTLAAEPYLQANERIPLSLIAVPVLRRALASTGLTTLVRRAR